MSEFTIKDSGERAQFESGMVRDTTEGKIDYTLALDGPMFDRYAIHLTKGAEKYAKRNWMQAKGQEELDRFKESALRHFLQWYRGHTDEDHAAAVWFNINGAEYVKAVQRESDEFFRDIYPPYRDSDGPVNLREVPKADCGYSDLHGPHGWDGGNAGVFYCPGRAW